MAAAHAVFDTYELLERILLHLSPVNITKVMRVAHRWCDIITRSTILKGVRVPPPVQKTSHNRGTYMRENFDVIPLYLYETDIQFNPKLCTRKYSTDSRFNTSLEVYLSYAPTRDLIGDGKDQARLCEYATRPLCQALAIMLDGIDAVIYVKSGIRIGDLQHVVECMDETARRYEGREPEERSKEVVRFAMPVL